MSLYFASVMFIKIHCPTLFITSNFLLANVPEKNKEYMRVLANKSTLLYKVIIISFTHSLFKIHNFHNYTTYH